ncbi:MAG: hypothetical protein ACRD6N_06945 [Pyrinomonadaceae bacterium]
MITIEQRVQRIVEANWGDKQTLIHEFTHEMHLLRSALPSAADLESIAHQLEIGGGREVVLPDGTFFDASVLLRRAAELIRLAMNEEAEGETRGDGGTRGRGDAATGRHGDAKQAGA